MVPRRGRTGSGDAGGAGGETVQKKPSYSDQGSKDKPRPPHAKDRDTSPRVIARFAPPAESFLGGDSKESGPGGAAAEQREYPAPRDINNAGAGAVRRAGGGAGGTKFPFPCKFDRRPPEVLSQAGAQNVQRASAGWFLVTITAEELRGLGPIPVQGQGQNDAAQVQTEMARRARALRRLSEFLVGLQPFIAHHVRAAKGAVRSHLKKTVRDLESSAGVA